MRRCATLAFTGRALRRVPVTRHAARATAKVAPWGSRWHMARGNATMVVAVTKAACLDRKKSKDRGRKGKAKGGGGAAAAQAEDVAESTGWSMAATTKATDATLDHFKNELTSLRSGKPTPELLNSVHVDGDPITAYGQVSVPDARSLLVSLYDEANASLVANAIRASDLGLNPQAEGNVLRIPVPKMTAEVRQTLVKRVQKLAESARVSLRRARQDALKTVKGLKKSEKLPEDAVRAMEAQVQQHIDAVGSEVDTIAARKEKDLSQL